jgi:beta-lactam-binding protein with PASTA domain
MSRPPDQPPGPDDETVVRDDWGPEDDTVVERTVEEEPPGRRPPTIWPWLLGLLVLVLLGLGALWYFTRDDDEEGPATTAAQTVTVPDVVGTTSSEATATLGDAGLEANVVDVPSDAPAGQVVAQDPAAGEEVEEGSSVRLNVARAGTTTEGETTTGETTTGETTTGETTTGETTTAPTTTAAPEPSVVPNAVGQPAADAARAFAEEGLLVDLIYVPASEPVGQVVSQGQPAESQLERGSVVLLNVSRGDNENLRSLPDVVGLERADALEQLDEVGFEALALKLDEGVGDRVVIQTPEAGAATPPGALAVLYLGG